MKSSFFATALMLAFLVSSSAVAVDTSHPTKPTLADISNKSQKQVAKPQKVAVTGSYIKQQVRPDGTIPSGPSPLRVIDSEAIRNSGASDVIQLLVKKGYNR